jgi:hypothetical protein
MRAGSWDCIQVKNESIAARRWLLVDAVLCRLVRSQVRKPGDGGGVDQLEGELLRRDGPLVPEVADQQFERVTVGGDRVGRVAAQPGQVSGQEPAQEYREVSGHDAALP